MCFCLKNFLETSRNARKKCNVLRHLLYFLILGLIRTNSRFYQTLTLSRKTESTDYNKANIKLVAFLSHVF